MFEVLGSAYSERYIAVPRPRGIAIIRAPSATCRVVRNSAFTPMDKFSETVTIDTVLMSVRHSVWVRNSPMLPSILATRSKKDKTKATVATTQRRDLKSRSRKDERAVANFLRLREKSSKGANGIIPNLAMLRALWDALSPRDLSEIGDQQSLHSVNEISRGVGSGFTRFLVSEIVTWSSRRERPRAIRWPV